MKYVLFICWLFSLSQSATAQTDKGRWLVGAQAGRLTYRGPEEVKAISAELAPTGGYLLANNLLIGLGIPVSYAFSRTYGGFGAVDPLPGQSTAILRFDQTSLDYGLSPFIRYYIGNAKLKPYAGASFTYGRTKQKRDVSGQVATTLTGRYRTLAPSVGVAYFLARNAALSAGLGYDLRRDTKKYPDLGLLPSAFSYSTQSLDVTIGFQLLFGR